jgi:GAF domain-containing protein
MPESAGGADAAAALADLAGLLASDLAAGNYLNVACQHAVRLIGAESAVICYAAEPGGDLSGIAGSDDRGRALARKADGPWRDCARSGQLITITDLRTSERRWPRFTRLAMAAGFRAVTLVPVGPEAARLGSLAALGGQTPDMTGIRLTLSLADAVAAGLVISAELGRRQAAIAQLQSALTTRIVIEQAKGILAERWQVGPDEAFDALRRHARARQRALADLAQAIIDGSFELTRPDSA